MKKPIKPNHHYYIMDLKKTVKVKKAISGKSFRLIDFHIYNQSPEPESDDSGTDSYKPKTSKTFEPTNFVIQMFGINEKGETCCVYLDNYQPF